MRETEEKKQLLKRKREQGKRWFTKPERLDRRNENGAKLQQDPRFYSPLEHTGVSSEVRHFSLELGFPVFWPPQNVHPAVAGTPHLSRKKALSAEKKRKRANEQPARTRRRRDEDQTKTRPRPRRRPDEDRTTTGRGQDEDRTKFGKVSRETCPLSELLKAYSSFSFLSPSQTPMSRKSEKKRAQHQRKWRGKSQRYDDYK